MSSISWPALPPYESWRGTCDTLHAHSQLLGKLGVALAPREPELQHAALQLTGRGWETHPIPAPDASGLLNVALDLRTHEAVVEFSEAPTRRFPLTPDRPVANVTSDVLSAVRDLLGDFEINLTPQEVPWEVPLDQDHEHRTYDPSSVETYFRAALRAAIVLAELRAPYRGRSTPVNAWWGSFDLAVSLYSGLPATPPSNDFITRNAGDAQQIEVGWWPGDARYPRPAFFGYAYPTPDAFSKAQLSPPGSRWDNELGEFMLDWDDVIAASDPHMAALEFGRSVVAHGCTVCDWDPDLANSAMGEPPPVI
ncbi:MAG TPA: DUF5996 family protein [Acidimicrobiales bacterium]|nr:DUF5996 family protein [Acidimicrobiales bacterium]